MTTFEEDKKEAISAINRLFGNTSVTKAETREAMEELLETVKDNIQILQERW
jgi:hypothetical protein